MRWAGHEARKGDKRGTCRVKGGKIALNRPLETLRGRREDDIKMNFQVMVGVWVNRFCLVRFGRSAGWLVLLVDFFCRSTVRQLGDINTASGLQAQCCS